MPVAMMLRPSETFFVKATSSGSQRIKRANAARVRVTASNSAALSVRPTSSPDRCSSIARRAVTGNSPRVQVLRYVLSRARGNNRATSSVSPAGSGGGRVVSIGGFVLDRCDRRRRFAGAKALTIHRRSGSRRGRRRRVQP